jgi:hydroxypyruvate isomerase
MPRLAANLSMLYTELPFLDRFAAAARSGFAAVECLFPYEFDSEEINSKLRQNQLSLVLHNLPAGDWAAGERGLACHPGREAEFRAGVDRALAVASVLGTPRINCLAGIVPPGVTEQQARHTLVANLRYAAAALQAQGIALLLEPINRFDVPGFLVHRTDQALAVLDDVGSPNLWLQYDIYHAQRTEGDIVATLRRCLPRIGHIQLADNPGRHEPGTGELHWPRLLAELDALGYTGHVGCEYRPLQAGPGGTEAGLGWVQAMGCSLCR